MGILNGGEPLWCIWGECCWHWCFLWIVSQITPWGTCCLTAACIHTNASNWSEGLEDITHYGCNCNSDSICILMVHLLSSVGMRLLNKTHYTSPCICPCFFPICKGFVPRKSSWVFYIILSSFWPLRKIRIDIGSCLVWIKPLNLTCKFTVAEKEEKNYSTIADYCFGEETYSLS